MILISNGNFYVITKDGEKKQFDTYDEAYEYFISLKVINYRKEK